MPLRTIRTSGSSQFVETLDGATRKSIPVHVGIVSGTDAEIVSGLNDSDVVVLDSSTDGNQATVSRTPVAAPVTSTPTAVATHVPQMAQNAPADNPGAVSAAHVVHTSAAFGGKAQTAAATTRMDEWFMNNTRSWPSDPNGTAWIADGVYNLATRQAAQFVAIGIPGASDLNDATITANFRKTGGPAGGGYGIVLRAQDPASLDGSNQNGHFYVFEAGNKGEFGVWLRDNDKWIDVVPWTASPAVNPDTANNRLTLTADGDQLTFSVNGRVVTTQTDT